MEFISDEVGCYPSGELFEVTEMTEHWYWHFFGCMPPIRDARMPFGFMVGEPHSHVQRVGRGYVPTYRYCFKHGDRYFSALMPYDFSADEMAKVLSQAKAA